VASRTQVVLLALIAGLSGGLAVAGLSRGASLPQTPGATDGSEADRIGAQIKELRHAIDASLSELGARISHPPPMREAVESRHQLPQLEAKLAELTAAVKQLNSAGGLNIDRIAAARLANSSPNVAEVRLLFDSLETPTGAERAKRSWLLLSMEEVIRKLGTPMNILHDTEKGNRQLWEYFLGDEQAVVVQFVDGLVVAVSM
jgi:hypothetical protein